MNKKNGHNVIKWNRTAVKRLLKLTGKYGFWQGIWRTMNEGADLILLRRQLQSLNLGLCLLTLKQLKGMNNIAVSLGSRPNNDQYNFKTCSISVK